MDGYKPALLIEKTSKNLPLLKGYPFCDYNECFLLCFQSEDRKMEYLHQNKGLEENSYEENRLLGLTLGYPEKSVEFFSQNNEIEKKQECCQIGM